MSVNLDYFSLVSVPIFMHRGPDLKSHGAAFFYQENGEIYLITNWHNLAGRDANSGQPIDSTTGATPHSISLSLHSSKELGEWGNSGCFPLYDKDGTALWWEHPTYGRKVDIAVLKISIPPEFRVYPLNELPSANIRVDIGMDVFILGFPIRTFTGIFPIWKRGSIASEYDILVDGIPKLLIDTATQKGMSGSPVILIERRPYTDSVDGQTKFTTPYASKFLGIYSGRHGSDNIAEAQLGIVWRKELIDIIIALKTPGKPEIY